MPEKQDFVINSVVDVFAREDGVESIFLSGSLAKNQGDKYSDIDIYIITKNGFADKLFEGLHPQVRNINSLLFAIRTDTTKRSAVFVFDDQTELAISVLDTDEIHPSPAYETIKTLFDPNETALKLSEQSKDLPVSARIDVLLRVESLFLWGAMAARKRLARNCVWDARDALEKMRYLIIKLNDLREGDVLGYKNLESRLTSKQILKLSKTASAYDKDAVLSSIAACFDLFIEVRDEIFKSFKLKPNHEATERIRKSLMEFR